MPVSGTQTGQIAMSRPTEILCQGWPDSHENVKQQDQPTEKMQAVESGQDVEKRTVRITGYENPQVHQLLPGHQLTC